MEFFSTSTVSVPDDMLKLAKNLGIKKNILSPTVYEVRIKGNNILVTSNPSKARTAFKNGYDACIYTGSGTVDNIAELIIYNENLINITNIDSFEISNGYSGNLYDIATGTLNNVVYPAVDPSIFEIKYPNTDIIGNVVGDI